MLFNFVGRPLGESSDLLVPVDEYMGSMTSPAGNRDHAISISAEVTSDGVTLTVVYSEAFHDRETIENLAAQIVAFSQQGAEAPAA